MTESALPEVHGLRGLPGSGVGAGVHDDELERSLLEVKALVESTVVTYRNRLSRRALLSEVVVEDGTMLAMAEEMISQATQSVTMVLAAHGEQSRVLRTAAGRLLDHRADSPAARVLFSQAVPDAAFVRRLSAGRGTEVRVTGMPVVPLLIADARTALACADSPVGRRASVFRSHAVIRTMHTLFDAVWRTAVSAPELVDPGGRARDDRAREELNRQVLGRLQAGVTDEVAARELAVSVRTYRRYVAEIMTRLGASSRFQAGVRAAELGLLTTVPEQRQPSSAD